MQRRSSPRTVVLGRQVVARDRLAERAMAGRAGIGPLRRISEPREYQISKPIGLLEMRIARQDEGVDAELPVLCQPGGHDLRVADQRCAGPAANESDPGPQVRADLELVAPATVQLDHASLADRIHPG